MKGNEIESNVNMGNIIYLSHLKEKKKKKSRILKKMFLQISMIWSKHLVWIKNLDNHNISKHVRMYEFKKKRERKEHLYYYD